MRKLGSLLFLVLLVLHPAGSPAMEVNHPAATDGAVWLLDGIRLTLQVEPKGDRAQVSVVAGDQTSGSATLQTDLAVAFQPAAVAAMAMPEMQPAAAPTPQSFSLDEPLTAPALPTAAFASLSPSGQAGRYQVGLELPAGDYQVLLAVRALGHRHYGEPVVLGASLNYRPTSGISGRNLAASLLFLLMAGAILGLAVARAKAGTVAGKRFNLLTIGWFYRFYRSRWFPTILQLPLLLLTGLIVLAALFGPSQGHLNIATVGVWTLWWAGVVFTFLFFARSWCLMCPLGAIQDWVQRLIKPLRAYPRRWRNLWLTTAIFVLLTWFNSFSGLVNRPVLTAALLFSLFMVAVAVAMAFRGRSFCRYLCPIGGVIGIYAMASPLQLRPALKQTCDTPHRKNCILGTEQSNPCPMYEVVPQLEKNAYCNLCGECIKGCSQHNIQLSFGPFGQDLWDTNQRRLDEAVLTTIMVGLSLVVTAEMVGPWHGWLDTLIRLSGLHSAVAGNHLFAEKIVTSLLLFMGAVVPGLLLWAVAAWNRKRLIEHPTTRELFTRFAYMFIPIALATHLAHNLSHLLNEGGQIIPALKLQLSRLGLGFWNGGAATMPPLMGTETIYWLQIFIVLGLGGLALHAGFRISAKFHPRDTLAAYLPMALLALLLLAVSLLVLMQPMALRHTH